MWLSIWRTVTAPQAAGRLGSRWPIVSLRPIRPCCTRCSTTAPLNALATLAIRMWSRRARRARVVDVGAADADRRQTAVAVEGRDRARRPALGGHEALEPSLDGGDPRCACARARRSATPVQPRRPAPAPLSCLRPPLEYDGCRAVRPMAQCAGLQRDGHAGEEAVAGDDLVDRPRPAPPSSS